MIDSKRKLIELALHHISELQSIIAQFDDCPLTDRQREVLQLRAYGLTNKQIAERLRVSRNTVMQYAKTMLIALEVDRPERAIALASQRGWIKVQGGER